MKSMGTDGQRIPTPEEREASQPMQTIMSTCQDGLAMYW